MRAPSGRRGVASAVATIIGLAVSMVLIGSRATPAETNKPTIERLKDDIQKQKAIIDRLLQRLTVLEQASRAQKAAAAPSPPKPPRRKTQIATRQAPPEPDSTSAAAPDPRPVDSPSAPGRFQVTESDAERALERTLIATGNLLVPKGYIEVEPLFGYTRREQPTSVVFNLNRNEFNWALDTRIGLPWESQFEISLPYNLAQQQVTDAFVSPAQQVFNRWGDSFGDVSLGVAKTFVHEHGWIPDLLGRITYEIPTGPQSVNQVPLPSGRNALAFALTALKRQDPLVFVASGGYTKAFQSGGINPGNQINFQLGAFLATSPETTLRGVLQQNFVDDMVVHDTRVPGSGGVQSVLTFGGSSILYRSVLLDLQVGIGLTTAAPKYSVILSSTYRFGIP